MIAVRIFRRRAEDGQVEHLGRVVVGEPGEPARIEAAMPQYQEGLETLLGMGIADAAGRWLRPEDGETYVLALPQYYAGSRLWAEPESSGEEGQGPPPAATGPREGA